VRVLEWKIGEVEATDVEGTWAKILRESTE